MWNANHRLNSAALSCGILTRSRVAGNSFPQGRDVNPHGVQDVNEFLTITIVTVTESDHWQVLVKYLEKRTKKLEKYADQLNLGCCGKSLVQENPGRQVSWGPHHLPSHSPQGWITVASPQCQADTWHCAKFSVGSSLSWVMRLGLLGAFNYQPNVQTHFPLETFTQAVFVHQLQQAASSSHSSSWQGRSGSRVILISDC